jgi:hypothetical protein
LEDSRLQENAALRLAQHGRVAISLLPDPTGSAAIAQVNVHRVLLRSIWISTPKAKAWDLTSSGSDITSPVPIHKITVLF